MHQNDRFVVMSSRELIWSSQATYTYIDVHYRKNNGVSSKLARQYCYTVDTSGYDQQQLELIYSKLHYSFCNAHGKKIKITSRREGLSE
jgi:hypothetical protein